MAAKKNETARKPSALKRTRQIIKARARNFAQRSESRTAIKKVRLAIAEKDIESAKARMREAIPTLDTLARKQIIHRNKAARLKSRLNAEIKSCGNAR